MKLDFCMNIAAIEKTSSQYHLTDIKEQTNLSIRDIKRFLMGGIYSCQDKYNLSDYQELAHEFLNKTKDLQSNSDLEILTIDLKGQLFVVEEVVSSVEGCDDIHIMITDCNEIKDSEEAKKVKIKGRTLLGLRENFLKKATVNTEEYRLPDNISKYKLSNSIDYATLMKIYLNAAPTGFEHSSVEFASELNGNIGSIYYSGGRVRLLHECGPKIDVREYQRGMISNELKNEYIKAVSACSIHKSAIDDLVDEKDEIMDSEVFKRIESIKDEVNLNSIALTRQGVRLDSILGKIKNSQESNNCEETAKLEVIQQEIKNRVTEYKVAIDDCQERINELKKDNNYLTFLEKKIEIKALKNKSVNLTENISATLTKLVDNAKGNVIDKHNLLNSNDMCLFEFSVNPEGSDGEIIHFSRGVPITISLQEGEDDIIYGFVSDLEKHMEYAKLVEYGPEITDEVKESEEYEEFEKNLYKQANKELYDLLPLLPTLKNIKTYNPEKIKY